MANLGLTSLYVVWLLTVGVGLQGMFEGLDWQPGLIPAHSSDTCNQGQDAPLLLLHMELVGRMLRLDSVILMAPLWTASATSHQLL